MLFEVTDLVSYTLVALGTLVLSFFVWRFYLFIHETHTHTERERGRDRQREKQAPCREPDVGLDAGTPESHPEPRQMLNR